MQLFKSIKSPFSFLKIFKKKDKERDLSEFEFKNVSFETQGKNYMEDGVDIKWEDAIEFTFPIQGGRVIKVYDGDTITIASKLPYNNSPLYRLSVRLHGIDAPEIKGNTEDEKNAARIVRDALASLILNKYVTLKNIQNEKYGRILAEVFIDDICVNEWLLKEKYAIKYDGKTKKTPLSWLKYRLTGEIV